MKDGIEAQVLRVAKRIMGQTKSADNFEVLLHKFFTVLNKVVIWILLSAAALSRMPFIFGAWVSKHITKRKTLVQSFSSGAPLSVAIARFDGLGDHVLTIPLIEALAADPRFGEITWYVPPKLIEVLQSSLCTVRPLRPYSVHYPIGGRSRFAHLITISGIGQWAAFLSGRKHRGRHDLVLLPRWDADYALNARAFSFGLGGHRVGHSPAMYSTTFPVEKFETALINTIVTSEGQDRHELEHLRDFCQALKLELPSEAAYGLKFFSSCSADASSLDLEKPLPFIVIHPGATDAKRRWPAERWAKVIERLSARYPRALFYVVATPSELNLIDELKLGAPSANFLDRPRESLPLVSALLGANLFIGGDSGPMHLASSLGVPTVIISSHSMSGERRHVNSPSRFGPKGSNGVWLAPAEPLLPCKEGCSRLNAHCILEVQVDQVAASALGLLGNFTQDGL